MLCVHPKKLTGECDRNYLGLHDTRTIYVLFYTENKYSINFENDKITLCSGIEPRNQQAIRKYECFYY